MSFIDDNYGEIIAEQTMAKNAIERLAREKNDWMVVKDAKELLIKYPDDKKAEFASQILDTIDRLGRVSIKQKRVLCNFLFNKHKDYKWEEQDHPLSD